MINSLGVHPSGIHPDQCHIDVMFMGDMTNYYMNVPRECIAEEDS